jgi:hypothetical protein
MCFCQSALSTPTWEGKERYAQLTGAGVQPCPRERCGGKSAGRVAKIHLRQDSDGPLNRCKSEVDSLLLSARKALQSQAMHHADF